MRHGFDLTVARTEGSSAIYLEAAAGVTAFLLLGRYLEARSKRKAGAALRALMELGAKDVAVLRGGREVRVPVEQLLSVTGSSYARARRSPRTARSPRAEPLWTLRC